MFGLPTDNEGTVNTRKKEEMDTLLQLPEMSLIRFGEMGSMRKDHQRLVIDIIDPIS